MWSETRARTDAERDATGLTLEDLIAMQPRHVRGALAPGQRIPGGERLGKGRAQSLEFDGLSPYAPGDDVRWIDWRSTARTGRAQVRRFAAQSHRARLIVVDLSPALFFGTQDRVMAKTGALAAARLAWQGVLLQEPVDILAPGLEERRPRRGRRHVLGRLDGLCDAYARAASGDAAWDLGQTLTTAASRLTHGDEIWVISEFAVQGSAFEAASRALSGIRTLHALLLEDPIATRPLPAGDLPLRRADGTRDTVHVDASADTLGRMADERTRRRRWLQDLGWQVNAALDVLPRREGSGTS